MSVLNRKSLTLYSMSKIGIIGCGWLGTPLAISFLKKGCTVVGTTSTEEKKESLRQLGIRVHHWQLSDQLTKFTCEFLNDLEILILNIPPSKVKSELSYSLLLQKFGGYLSEKTKVIFISTTSVYPDSIQEASEEYKWTDLDLQKETVQAEIKLRAILGSQLTILRLAGLIGNDRHPVKFISGKQEIPNGNSPVNLIHIDDVIRIIEQIIERNYWGEVLNACYPNHPIKKLYYAQIAEKLGIPIPEFKNELGSQKRIISEKSIHDLGYNYRHEI